MSPNGSHARRYRRETARRVLSACQVKPVLVTPETRDAILASDCSESLPVLTHSISRRTHEIRFLTSLKGRRAAYDSREPLRRVRPVGVVPPAVRVPAEAVALRLD